MTRGPLWLGRTHDDVDIRHTKYGVKYDQIGAPNDYALSSPKLEQLNRLTQGRQMSSLSGQLIRGYKLRELIGAGGFGAVYRAHEPAVDREVAIKVILPQHANEANFIRRFEAEARCVAHLEHPHIVPLYNYWRKPDGAYLVMRWLPGSLRAELKRGPLSLEETASVFDQIAGALAFAHRHGIVHRDLKPDNILLDEDGNAYLADFGIAKEVINMAAISDSDGFGTISYAAPEQFTRKPITPQTDIYSLGVVLYETLTGRHPFSGSSEMEIVRKVLDDPLPPLAIFRSGLPAGLDVVIQKATAKSPAERYPDAVAFSVDVRQALASEAIPVVTESTLLLARVNPYKGLRAFQEFDGADFFGREVLTQRLLARLGEPEPMARFLAVVGPSGSGKSSVVNAGLIPALRRGDLPNSDRWFIVEMFPGAHPLAELEAALLRVAVNPPPSLIEQLERDEQGLLRAVKRVLPEDETVELVLVIDQFEDLFTLVNDEDIRAHFLDSLLAAVNDPHSRLWVVAALRADFYDRPLMYTGFGDLIRQRTEVVLPLTAEELERAIVRPAERIGVSLRTGLVAAIIAEVNEQPGALPLLQYALTEVFNQREGNQLTLEAYQAIGGTLGALAKRADALYDALNHQEQDVARQLFLRLVMLGEGTEDTRRRVLYTELISLGDDPDRVDKVIEDFQEYRLLTLDHDIFTRGRTVELAHEAIIREWDRLRDWLDESREDVRLLDRLIQMADEWEQNECDPSFLVTGSRLDRFIGWAEQNTLTLNERERAYLEASIDRREENLRLDEARRAREAELERRAVFSLRYLVALLLLATVGASVLAGVAFTQGNTAHRNEKTAVAAQETANQNANSAQNMALASGALLALNDNNTTTALALAIAANRQESFPGIAQRALYEAAYAPGIRRRLVGHSGPVLAVGFGADGLTAVTASADHTLILWDTATGDVIRRFGADGSGHQNWVRSAAISPDNHTLLSGSDDQTLILWDIDTGAILRRFEGHTDIVSDVAFTPDGRMALSASWDKTLILWNVQTVTPLLTLTGHAGPVTSVAISPDGRSALSASIDGTLILWDLSTGAIIRRFEGHTAPVLSVAFGPDGTRALSGSRDRLVILWDVATGAALRRFEGHSDSVLSVAFSPDGQFAVSGSEDNKVILWNLTSGEIARRFEGHNGTVNGVAFSPDGQHILSGADDDMALVWDVESGELIRRMYGHTDWANAVAFSPDGTQAISAGSDNDLILWDVASGEIVRRFRGHTMKVWTAAFSPDGRTVLSGSDDTLMILWDATTGGMIRSFARHSDWINQVAYSPDGRTALSASGDATLVLWDLASGAPIRRFARTETSDGHTDAVVGVAFSPDGRMAASASYDGCVLLWDVETATVLRRFEEHTNRVNSVAFSPDGRTLLSASNDKTVILWDVATGARIYRLEGHTNQVNSVVFSPDGRFGLSAAFDGSVILWDLTVGEPVNRFDGHTGPVSWAVFSPDGKTILSAAQDNSLILWRVDSPEDVIAWAYVNRYVRELTCAERRLYSLEPGCDGAGSYPTRTPFLTSQPTLAATPSPAHDMIQVFPVTITPTLTPLPSNTPTPIPPRASPGESRGAIVKGDYDTWTYEGHAGETVTISVYADKPANDLSTDEVARRGLLDTLLKLRAPDGRVVAEADDIADGRTDSRIEGFLLDVNGTYTIEVHSYGNQMAGEYTLIIETNPPTR
jgi:WD40 repeat protein